MIPRIDPHSLLKCLSVLLNLSGGIKSKEDVARIVSLMSKFSKKLVSKCVYVEILHATSEDLLEVYMNEGGWELVSQWIMDAVDTTNGPLLETLLTLTQKSQLGLNLLEINDCPRVVKTLTSIAPNERVKSLAAQLVTRWIEVAKQGLQPADLEKVEEACKNSQFQITPMEEVIPSVSTDNQDLLDPNQVLTMEEVEREVSMEEVDETVVEEEEEEEGEEEEYEDGTEEDEGGLDEQDMSKPLGELPVYKITIKNGKQVLAKVTSAKTSSINIPATEVNSEPPSDVPVPEPVKEGPKGAARRKQQLTPVNEPLLVSDAEKKKTPAQESKISAKVAKEEAAKRAERAFKEKNKKLKEKLAEREAKKKAQKEKEQEEKDKANQATLAKVMGTGNKVSLGKIPKKVKTEDGDKKSSDPLRRSSTDDDKKKKTDSKGNKSPSSSSSRDKRESRSSSSKSSSPALLQPVRHKVKTFNSKLRSTGLEEESPLPPPRGQSKKDQKDPSYTGKRSPPPMGKEQTPPEKKSKLDEIVKKVNGKPKTKQGIQLLQESNFFMDALTAGVKNEPRKRKRRVSSSKDDGPVAPKAASKEPASPNADKKPEKSSLSTTPDRPTFNFYTDTLVTPTKSDVDLNESESKDGLTNSENRTPTPPNEGIVEEPSESSESLSDPTKGVLVIHRSIDRVKKSVRFKVDEELVSIRFFELDETERVNVTKMGGAGASGDMKMSDAAYERGMMDNAKKNGPEIEVIETNVPWRLILIDAPPPLAELGKNSIEKEIQKARENTVLQVIYFSPSTIPDTSAEPDPENIPITDPVSIPMDDMTGNPDSFKDFSHIPWAEPKSFQPPGQAAVGGWRTGDGQVLSMTGPADQFQTPPPFNPGYETGNAGNFGYQTPNFNPQDFNMNGMNPNMNGMNPNMMGMMNNMMPPNGPNFMQFPPGANQFPPGNNQFPPGNNNFVPPPGVNNWGPPMGPGGFRGRGHMRGGPGRGYFAPRGGPRDRPMNRERTTPCKHFSRGYCRNGSSCNFKH